MTATKNFESDTLLGKRGFGKGAGVGVSMKKLNPESLQGFQEWQSKVNFQGRLSHPNLVWLLGYFWEDKELLVMFEFMLMGSLDHHLCRWNPSIEPLSWDIWLKIAIGAGSNNLIGRIGYKKSYAEILKL